MFIYFLRHDGMIKYMQELGRSLNPAEMSFIERLADENIGYIKGVIEIVRQPILVLNADLRVVAANDPFCQAFQVERRDAEDKLVYELGNGQWDIPALRKLLEEILPQNKFFKDFEVIHTFPSIGPKTMFLNARQIHPGDHSIPKLFPPFIFLAIEDVSAITAFGELFSTHLTELASRKAQRMLQLETDILELKQDIKKTKKTPKTKIQKTTKKTTTKKRG